MRRAVSIAILVVPQLARGGGLYVGESGSQAMERGGAFVAKADDPTAISINPAGLVATEGLQLYLGANLVHYDLSFQRAGSYPLPSDQSIAPSYVGTPFPAVANTATFQPIPLVAASLRLGRLALGGGVFGPTAAGRRSFPCVTDHCDVASGGAPAPQRYDIVAQSGIVAFPSLAAAYRVLPRLDLGVRVSWGFAGLHARSFGWGSSNLTEDPQKDGDVEASVFDPFVPAFGAGVLFRPTDFLELGAAYTSGARIHAQGTASAAFGNEVSPFGSVSLEPLPDDQARCGTGGTPALVRTCLDMRLPQIVSIGARYVRRDAAGEKLDLELDVRWENWRAASDELATIDARDAQLGVRLQPSVVRHGFQDVLAVRAGGAYRLGSHREGFSIRAGVSHDTAAAPDSWTRLDKDGKARTAVSLGAAYRVSTWIFDAGLAFVHEPRVVVTNVPLANPAFADRVQPDVVEPSRPAYDQPFYPINAGTYDSGYVIAILGMTRTF